MKVKKPMWNWYTLIQNFIEEKKSSPVAPGTNVFVTNFSNLPPIWAVNVLYVVMEDETHLWQGSNYYWDGLQYVYIGSSGMTDLMIDILHADLLVAMWTGTLIPGMFYRITDFVTKHIIAWTTDIHTGTPEVLIVQAQTSSRLMPTSQIENYSDHTVEYDPSNTDMSSSIYSEYKDGSELFSNWVHISNVNSLYFDIDVDALMDSSFNIYVEDTNGWFDMYAADLWTMFTYMAVGWGFYRITLLVSIDLNDPSYNYIYLLWNILLDTRPGRITRRTDLTKNISTPYDFMNCVTRLRGRDQLAIPTWDIWTAYNKLDKVLYNNSVYFAIRANTGNDPTLWGTTNWMIMEYDFDGSVAGLIYKFPESASFMWLTPDPAIYHDFYTFHNLLTDTVDTSYVKDFREDNNTLSEVTNNVFYATTTGPTITDMNIKWIKNVFPNATMHNINVIDISYNVCPQWASWTDVNSNDMHYNRCLWQIAYSNLNAFQMNVIANAFAWVTALRWFNSCFLYNIYNCVFESWVSWCIFNSIFHDSIVWYISSVDFLNGWAQNNIKWMQLWTFVWAFDNNNIWYYFRNNDQLETWWAFSGNTIWDRCQNNHFGLYLYWTTIGRNRATNSTHFIVDCSFAGNSSNNVISHANSIMNLCRVWQLFSSNTLTWNFTTCNFWDWFSSNTSTVPGTWYTWLVTEGSFNNNTITWAMSSVTFGDRTLRNLFDTWCSISYTNFWKYMNNNTFRWIIGNCSFGNYITYNTFNTGSSFTNNTCWPNFSGNGWANNIFWATIRYNTFGPNFGWWNAGNQILWTLFQWNTVWPDCYGNVWNWDVANNNFGSRYYNNTSNWDMYWNSFQDETFSNTFTWDMLSNIVKKAINNTITWTFAYNHIDNINNCTVPVTFNYVTALCILWTIDFTWATLVSTTHTKEAIMRPDTTVRLRYVDDTDNTNIDPITS